MEPTELSALLQDPAFTGAYEVAGELGRGGFGRVFRARQRSTGREVAIKVAQLVDEEVADAARRRLDRFKRELALCAELSHPNIVRLIDSGEASDGTLYAVFEHVVGATLKDVLATEGSLDPREAAHLLAQVLDALSCAHARGIVHRDVTPANIMVTRPGARRNALVLDFGLGGFDPEASLRSAARITATSELLGTPCYAAPEQLRGERPSPASDLYSWGLVLLECLTGELPFRGASAQDVVFQQLGPDPVAIPRALKTRPLGGLIERVCAKRVDDRLVDVAEILGVLADVASTSAPARVAPREEPSPERERRQLTVTCYRLSVRAAPDVEIDVEEVDELIRTQRAALAALADTTGGTVVAVLADRIFTVHGYPHAREGDARRAARTALDFVQRRERASHVRPQSLVQWEVHAGVHTGLVIVPDAARAAEPQALALTGLTAQIASRLADLAASDEVLVSADTRNALGGGFASEPAGECTMSELSRPIAVFRVAAEPAGAISIQRGVERRTPLVGRGAELERLLAGWQAAQRREPSAVVISGEAGMGKSRLLRELVDRVGHERCTVWQCTAEGSTTALRPVVDALAGLSEPLDGFLSRLALSAQDQALVSALVATATVQPDPTSLDASPDRQKALTVEAILTLAFRMAERQPIVLAVENLHWADPTTIELLRALTFELGGYRGGRAAEGPQLFVVLTARPEAVPGWGDESLSFLPLQRLGPDEVAQMVRAQLGEREPSPELIDAVLQRAEGIPLFVEEVTRLAADAERRRSATQSGAHRATTAVPASLRDLLTARLDGVSPSARETARVASVLGREFGVDLLQAVSSRGEVELRSDVAELAQAGLMFPRRTGGGQRCVFRHALLQDATYEGLTRDTREALHRRVAQALHARFADVVERRPELLALHHERGGELRPAALHWLLAGARSYRAAAYVESLSQLQHGLDAVGALGDSPEDRALEVNLLVTYGTSLLSTRGWADPAVEVTFQRAVELAERDGGEAPLMALYGLWGVLITTSNRPGVEAFLLRLERRMADTQDAEVRNFCVGLMGVAASWRGDIRSASRLLEDALASYDERRAHAAYDPGMYTYAFEFCGLWSEGYPDRAQRLRDEAFALARRRRDPYSLGVVLAFGTVLALCRAEGDDAIAFGQELMTLATEQRLLAFWPAGACAFGAGLALNGRPEEGLQFVLEGLERYRLFGIMGSYSTHQVYLAEVYLQLDRTDDALAAVECGLALCATQYARFHESELLRLRSEVWSRRGDLAAAERDLRRALTLCEEQGNRGMGLRAACALATLLLRTGRADEGRAVLAPCHAGFTEGFATADLRRAQAILDALA